MWPTFALLVLILLALDLGVLHKRNQSITLRQSLYLSAFYVFTALLFGLWVWYSKDSNSAALYLTGFLIEKSLSLDNIFVIALVFSYLKIPAQYQHRVLFWGILGAILLRGIMIALGAHLIAKFSWLLCVFGVLMLITGVKFMRKAHQDQHHLGSTETKLLEFIKSTFNITNTCDSDAFYFYQHDPLTKTKKLYFSPLFLALLVIEFMDLIFACDSIPAIFAITQDPYIVYTSNIFAIMGLRALYFALADILQRFYYLNHALAAILIFIGSKILLTQGLGIHVPALISLGTTCAILIIGITASLLRKPPKLAAPK